MTPDEIIDQLKIDNNIVDDEEEKKRQAVLRKLESEGWVTVRHKEKN